MVLPSGDIVRFVIWDHGRRTRTLPSSASGVAGWTQSFGIAIAREILELNGGSLRIARSEAGGLEATARIPAAPVAL